jgi:S-adenosylmethionine synthetase
VNTFGTGKIDDEKLADLIKNTFPLKPAEIIHHFDLKKPIYRPTSCYGHFGREDFPWEDTDMTKKLTSKV